jgi:hypothetical protein
MPTAGTAGRGRARPYPAKVPIGTGSPDRLPGRGPPAVRPGRGPAVLARVSRRCPWLPQATRGPGAGVRSRTCGIGLLRPVGRNRREVVAGSGQIKRAIRSRSGMTGHRAAGVPVGVEVTQVPQCSRRVCRTATTSTTGSRREDRPCPARCAGHPGHRDRRADSNFVRRLRRLRCLLERVTRRVTPNSRGPNGVAQYRRSGGPGSAQLWRRSVLGTSTCERQVGAAERIGGRTR